MLILSLIFSSFYAIKCSAAEIALTVGVASAGTALLGLLALSGVGMELDNNRKFNELSEEEKNRLQNGLAQNFEEVALQRGASLEKIKNWTSDLCQGVLDKASECWEIFKEWAKNISLTTTSSSNPALNYPIDNIPLNVGNTFVINGSLGSCVFDFTKVNDTKKFFERKYSLVSYYYTISGSRYKVYAMGVSRDDSNRINYQVISLGEYNPNNDTYYNSTSFVTTVSNYPDYFYPQYWNSALLGFVCYGNDSIPMMINGELITDTNSYGQNNTSSTSLFNTNTDYLERLRGSDTVEVIDVTDIKHPIIETLPNTKAEIDFNRGTKRPSNKNDDDKIVGGLVPVDVWYQSLDDYVEQQNNAIVEYDNYINNNPEDKDKYFIATSPITNIHNYYNTLPVVNIPVGGTVVNNYYEYNNYNNNNVTIYELPYNAELIPMLPTLFFENKFPFCIPWDIYSFINIFRSEAVAPHFEIPYPYMNENGLQTYNLVIDLSEYNYVSNIFRVMFFILFIVGLMILTRKLIKG